jgi:hypothetical protein
MEDQFASFRTAPDGSAQPEGSFLYVSVVRIVGSRETIAAVSQRAAGSVEGNRRVIATYAQNTVVPDPEWSGDIVYALPVVAGRTTKSGANPKM